MMSNGRGHSVIDTEGGPSSSDRKKSKETEQRSNFLPDPTIFEKTKCTAEWLQQPSSCVCLFKTRTSWRAYVNKRAGERRLITDHEPDGIFAIVREFKITEKSRFMSRCILKAVWTRVGGSVAVPVR